MPNKRRQFSRIYDKNVEKIFRFIFLKVGSKEPAEDLCSTVFSKGWQKFKSKQKIDNPRAYLYQIARAEIANYYRWKAKAKVVPAEELELADRTASPFEVQLAKADLIDLQKGLAQLNEENQNLVIWRYVDGLSFKKLAGLTGKSSGALRVAARRALLELKKKMAGD